MQRPERGSARTAADFRRRPALGVEAVDSRRRPACSYLAVLLLLVPAACGGGGAAAQLALLDWPGRGGRPVLLDQALTLEFDHRLDPALRAGSFQLRSKEGRSVGPVEFEVSGNHLILYPRLPRLPDLSDGTLRPGAEYVLELVGVPHLAALTSPDGPALLGNRVLEFATLDAGDPSALAGEAAVLGSLQVLLPAGGAHFQAAIDRQGWVRIPVEPGIDPRSLTEPARLYVGAAPEPQEVLLELESNTVRRATLRVKVGRPRGLAALELPAGLEGLGGRRLLESDRRIRLLPLP